MTHKPATPLDLAQFEGHTPGHWHVGINPGPIVYSTRGIQVADCTFHNGGNNRIDARLIAAAPAILAKCAELIKALKIAEARLCKGPARDHARALLREMGDK